MNTVPDEVGGWMTFQSLIEGAQNKGRSASRELVDMIMRVLQGQATAAEMMFVLNQCESSMVLAVALVNGVKMVRVEVER